jgi:NADPH-dependent 2,4-dienoyl-CoA reductase/sulfur reductase-like enzyme
VLIVGAGPAGIAAGVRAKQAGADVLVVDDNRASGGQIWRASQDTRPTRSAASWFALLQASGVTVLNGTRVIAVDLNSRSCVLEDDKCAGTVNFESLILATGARELLLPFPGWTLPGVFGVGGIQALAKSGAPINGKRIVIAGSGPLLLAVAGYLRSHGAKVLLVAEQASRYKVAHFAAQLFRDPAKAVQAAGLGLRLYGVPYRTGSWVSAANGDGQVRRVHLQRGARTWTEECDYAAVAYGLRPNAELGSLLGCRVVNGAIDVDDFQHTSVPGVFAAGECTGIGGVDVSIAEGEIAGYAALGQIERATRLLAKRRRARRFADALNQAFALRSELKGLPQPETLVCRCEDVSFERLRAFSSFRAAKLHTRCGMGPCQGRICAMATEFLFGWTADNSRPPVFPARIATLIVHETQEV